MIAKTIIALLFSFSILFCKAQAVIIDVSLSASVLDSITVPATILKNELSKAGFPVTIVRQAGFPVKKNIFLTVCRTKIKLVGAITPGPEVFSIISDGKKVSISGNTALGVQHGIFKYLETLGFR